jgi:pimeloyl-ACP methyl ester carboxylesterase
METFDYQGAAVKYKRRGSGEPVVFLHNGGTSHAIWKDVIARLTDDYATFALDLPGFGASAKPGGGYALENYVAVLEAFLAHHGLSPVTLVGNCMGSAISVAYAMRHPEKVRALVLVNPLTAATYTAGRLGMTLRLRRRAPAFSRFLYGLLGRVKPNRWIAVQSLRMQFGPVGRSQNLHCSNDLCACFTGRGQMTSLLGVLDDLVNYEFLDNFVPPDDFPPRCTIWGLENEILSAKAGRRLNATLQPQRADWLKGVGHLLMLENPDEVARIIRELLAKTPRRKVHS